MMSLVDMPVATVSHQSLQSRHIPQLLVVTEFLPSSALGGPSHQGQVCILHRPRERQSDANKAREKAKHVDEDSENTELHYTKATSPASQSVSQQRARQIPTLGSSQSLGTRAPIPPQHPQETHSSVGRPGSSLDAITLPSCALSLDMTILANRQSCQDHSASPMRLTSHQSDCPHRPAPPFPWPALRLVLFEN